MQDYRRFALYYTPPAGAFLEAGESWLGRSARHGQSVVQPQLAGLDLAALSSEPRRYGFHATLKPPFRLATGKTPQALIAAIHAFAAQTAPVTIQGLRLAQIARFFAFIPQGDTAALDALAAGIVAAFDPFRAPLTASEIQRRRPESLSPRQRDLLDHWGYPYVFEEFRFHMTLSDTLDPRQSDALLPAITAHFAGLADGPFTLDAISLFGETKEGQFDMIDRIALRGPERGA